MSNHQNRQICIVTGGNSGIGFTTALDLAKQGAYVFIACRCETKARMAVERIRQVSANPYVEFLLLDLACLDSVRQFVSSFQERNLPLNILVNNAGIFNKRGTTKQGFELIWGTNYLGHFLLTGLLLDKLEDSAPSRIIIVASDLGLRPTFIDWNGLVKKTPFDFIKFYSLSKFCLLILTIELTRRLKKNKITVNAVHPGFVQSNITVWHRLSKFFNIGISSEKGAYGSIICATSSRFEHISGKFFDNQGKEILLPQIVKDETLGSQLWKQSCLWTGWNNL